MSFIATNRCFQAGSAAAPRRRAGSPRSTVTPDRCSRGLHRVAQIGSSSTPIAQNAAGAMSFCSRGTPFDVPAYDQVRLAPPYFGTINDSMATNKSNATSGTATQ
jgi:hypothetical protein